MCSFPSVLVLVTFVPDKVTSHDVTSQYGERGEERAHTHVRVCRRMPVPVCAPCCKSTETAVWIMLIKFDQVILFGKDFSLSWTYWTYLYFYLYIILFVLNRGLVMWTRRRKINLYLKIEAASEQYFFSFFPLFFSSLFGLLWEVLTLAGTPGTGVKGNCEMPCRCWDPNLCPL